MRVPVLAYHSNNVSGNDYADNDHVALATDLRLLARLGLRVVPLATVVDVLLGDAPASAVEGAVALSFDDGSWFDWHDIDHPTWGPQRGFAGILRDFAAESGAPVHATTVPTTTAVTTPARPQRLIPRWSRTAPPPTGAIVTSALTSRPPAQPATSARDGDDELTVSCRSRTLAR